ncbi:glycosyl hydrolase family 20, catalytic domain protein [gut metagenome]|uniref:beta-N-acetylhexosaminidase n=1 Tax=gut metagenome TaxID=749906 RepID=J9FBN1_9ZZZZ
MLGGCPRFSWAQDKGIVPAPQLVDWKGGTTIVSPDSITFRTVSLKIFNAITRLESVAHPDEAYVVEVTPGRAVVTAIAEPGLFYGMQSLKQLAEPSGNDLWKLPLGRVDDAPRFSYRGFMMDVSRHFRSKEFVKKQIDAMARYKLNRLHLHLTDAAGWRLEIKQYPRLTEFAAWRNAATWKEWWNESGGRKYCDRNDPEAQGGYYSQDDIRELVQYAAERQITIIPEIEMPSHSEEVLAAYPYLSCSGEPYKNSDFCVGNEEVFTFLENVLLEVIHLFPSEYIHIGGDEAGKQAWRTCPKCQRRMQTEGLENVDALQSYLIHRIEVFLNKHGRKLLGWDEIMDGGLTPYATVMSWRGEEGGLKAAKNGHQVVMTPGEFCYLDGYQDAPITQPEAIGGYLPLSKVYAYNPVPSSFSSEQAAMILGVQGNLWAEFIPTDAHYEYMAYPRMLAIAEVGWSRPEVKSYADFFSRVLREVEWLQQSGYHPFPLDKEIGERPETRQPIKHLALGKTVIYQAPYHPKYKAQGDMTLTDGQRGGWTYSDGAWQGFISEQRLDVMIDLKQELPIHEVYADFIQMLNPEVFLPEEVIISVSVDGVHFEELKRMNHTVDKTKSVCFQKYGWEGSALARYVRYQARTLQQVNGWIFTDEIIVN